MSDSTPIGAVTATLGEGYSTDLSVRAHAFRADEPLKDGGRDAGPTPVELLLASLASCTAITVRMYADRKEFPVREINAVAMRTDSGKGKLESVKVVLAVSGEVSEEQRQRILEVSKKCPVHQTLSAGVKIETVLED